MPKPELEFFAADQVSWTRVPGPAEGIYERILATNDESGTASRLVRFDVGCDTTPNGVQVHTFWEEVYIIEGALHDLTLDKTFSQGMYACRPPGMRHGPWISPQGCLLFEARYP